MNDPMKRAIELAKESLRMGNYGFGSVITQARTTVAEAHDTEHTDGDCTAHAEMNALRKASEKLGRNLEGCTLYSTHEPCPMCAAAIVWSGIKRVVFGFSIAEAVKEGRSRIEIGCGEMFSRSGAGIRIRRGVMHDDCAILYNEQVRGEIKKLRDATRETLEAWNQESTERRLQWFRTERPLDDMADADIKEQAYRLLLKRFNIQEEQAPVVHRDDRSIIFHSMNFCPTLEACKILKLDTREVCRRYNESATDALVKQVDARLSFKRNYKKLRPHTAYCEEMIVVS